MSSARMEPGSTMARSTVDDDGGPNGWTGVVNAAITMTYAGKQIEQWFERFPAAAQRLQSALTAVMTQTMEGSYRAMDLQRMFELNRTFASRLHRALSANSPREMASLLPGRPTMSRLVDRAAELCPSHETVNELREAYYAYLREIGRIASNKQELTAVLNADDPEAQREASLRQRAAMYRAATDLIGGNIEVVTAISMIWPNAADSRFGDMVYVQANFGLRRLGVMENFVIPSGASEDAAISHRRPSIRLDGTAFSENPRGAIVSEFSSANLPPTKTVSTNDVVYTAWRGENLPQGQSLDIVSAVRHDRWIRNIFAGEVGSEQTIIKPNVPTKTRVGDYLVHKDMWPGIEPVVKVYRDTDLPVSVNTAEGQSLLSDVANYDDIQPLPVANLLRPLSDAPKHAKLVQYLFDHIDMNLDDFRAYRHITRYPAIGQSIWIIFSRWPR